MTVVYMSEEPDHPGFASAQYKIGDKVKVVKVTLTESDFEDTRKAFLDALGKTHEIIEINLWEHTVPGQWHTTYEIQVGEIDYIFLNSEEIVAV